MKTKTIAAALLAVGLTGPLHAGVVFDGGTSDGQNALLATDGLWISDRAATKFELGDSLSFNRIAWSGGYESFGFEPTGVNSPDLFSFQLYSADGGLPGILLGSFSLGDGNRNATGNTFAWGADEYGYRGDFAMTTLGPGTYFASLSNAYAGDYNWFWGSTAGGPQLGTAFHDTDYGWFPGTSWDLNSGEEISIPGLAFQLLLSDSDNHVPEPGSLALLVLAMLGLATARQSTKVRSLPVMAI